MKSKPTKNTIPEPEYEMEAEYNFVPADGERGKFFKLLRDRGAMFVLIEPDIAEYFESAAAVNDALRSLIRLSNKATAPAKAKRANTATKRRVVLAQPSAVVKG